MIQDNLLSPEYIKHSKSEKVQYTFKKKNPHRHLTFTFIYKREIQPYYKHTLFCIVENVDNVDEPSHANGRKRKHWKTNAPINHKTRFFKV